MVKARSLDVSIKPENVYKKVITELNNYNIQIKDIIDVSNFEKDHCSIIIKF
jgi:fibrillarin-like rRNA methylase